ncbi:glycosyltransferase family 4 protein [Microbacterium sp. 22195]|uniref:glycosyltransferase family 4 protein n=1 Tax=Microbacterium sp. 22195 TaxID=3453891 RepID=UPI003F84C80B
MKWLIPLSEFAGVTELTGGVGRRYAAVLAELSALGVEPVVVLYPDTRLVENPELPLGIQLDVDRRWSWLPAFVRPVLRAVMFRRRIAKIKPDLIFAPEWLGAAAFAPSRIPLVTNLVTGIELMTEVEDSAGVAGSWRRSLQTRIQGMLERRQVRRSSRTIGCSVAITNWYKARFTMPHDAQVVRNCIDVERVRAGASNAPLPDGWPTQGTVLMHAGRVEARKGAHVSALAFNLIARKHPDLQLVFAGARGHTLPEWGTEGVLSLIDSDLRDRVVFLGNIRSDALYRAMAEAEVCMVPSLWEAFGNIALEVKASGTPLIVTSGSGFDDFCEDGVDARVVPPADERALAHVVSEMLGDAEQMRTLTQRAAIQVDDFSAVSVARDLQRAVEAPPHVDRQYIA